MTVPPWDYQPRPAPYVASPEWVEERARNDYLWIREHRNETRYWAAYILALRTSGGAGWRQLADRIMELMPPEERAAVEDRIVLEALGDE
jgi:hypothetical protein